MKHKTASPWETENLGESLAREIVSAGPGIVARVVALSGNLGSGKTTFTQGFYKGLGLKKRAMSPTFVILRRTAILKKGFKNVFHMDAYRLAGAADLSLIGFKEIISDPKNILLVEWSENIKKAMPKDSIKIKFSHGKKENERMIETKG